jgi:hypothetical protein
MATNDFQLVVAVVPHLLLLLILFSSRCSMRGLLLLSCFR